MPPLSFDRRHTYSSAPPAYELCPDYCNSPGLMGAECPPLGNLTQVGLPKNTTGTSGDNSSLTNNSKGNIYPDLNCVRHYAERKSFPLTGSQLSLNRP